MKHVLKGITNSRSSSASVVDGKLILSFPDAITPVVWQMDLTQTKASALEVREDKDVHTFTLALKNPKGENIDVASFEKRERAIDGLMAAASALENAHGQIRPANANSNSPPMHYKPQTRGKWLPRIFGLIIILILLSIWGSMQSQTSTGIRQTNLDSENALTTPSDAVGVPISADDFLRTQ